MRLFLIAIVVVSVFLAPLSSTAKWRPLKIHGGQEKTLNRVINDVKKTGRNAIVVFQLDSTLVDTRPRTIHILQEFGSTHDLPSAYRLQPDDLEHRSIEAILKKVGLNKKETEKTIEPLKSFWKERYFTNDYLRFDVALPGAVAYVKKIIQAGASVVYVTERSESVREGTERTLTQFGFPMRRAHLLMKPEEFQGKKDADIKFKKYAVSLIRPMGKVVAVFENEPAHANQYRALLKDTTVIFVDTDHSPRPDKPRDEFPVINGFLMD
ncbi:MAG: HAD family hydrolase [Deltaproteobacteria bacterium]|nr:HAD family hydrolase [Deltaproteobacteria bacterium]